MTTRPTAETHQPTPALPATMRAVAHHRYGTPEVLAVEEVPVPTPSPDQVLVRVEASSLNALDWHFLTGTPYFMRLQAGLRRPKRTIPGADVAGTVVAVGAGVTQQRPGDAVFGESEDGGACAPYATVDAAHVVAKPDGVSFEAAGATPVAGLTALQGLRTHAATREGDHVLINGAAGGVGTFAVQIAKALGANVTAVCSTRNLDMVRNLGADHVIDYTADDFVPGGRRFDVMFDNVGNRTPAEVRSVLRPDARYVMITGPKNNHWLDPIPALIRMRLALRKANATFHNFIASPNEDDLTFLGELLADGTLVPEIQRTVGLDGVADGIAELGTGHTRAKIAVDPDR
jgi:NADPH:quinone reductase-like Zn-dependent oxidoreductase